MPENTRPRLFPASVAHKINEYEIVINRGTSDGIEEGQRFLVYNLSDDEIVDPETNEDLGTLEIVKGTGRVTHVQVNIATITSDMSRPGGRSIRKPKNMFSWSKEIEETVIEPDKPIPFGKVDIGDKAKPI